jgi:hypothetical protein
VCPGGKESERMKRILVALGLLGLVYAAALPGASAQTVLFEDKFDTDAILKASTTFQQGFGNAMAGDDTIVPWYVQGGKLLSSPPDTVTSSDGTGQNHVDEDDRYTQYILLFGDKAWADVAFQTKVNVEGANTGQFGMILRATPKTKPSDPDTRYEFTYTTNGTDPGTVDPLDETLNMAQAKSGIAAPSVVPALRIYKVVNNVYKLLAETDHAKSPIHIPAINQNGVDHDDEVDGDPSTGNPTGAHFRFVAKGNVLSVFASLDGTKFEKYLEVTDTDNPLTAGLAGFTHCEYPPLFDYALITTAP